MSMVILLILLHRMVIQRSIMTSASLYDRIGHTIQSEKFLSSS
jgi:hypothetical protein